MYRYRNTLKAFSLVAQSTDNVWNKMWIQRSVCRLKPQTRYTKVTRLSTWSFAIQKLTWDTMKVCRK